MSGSTQLIPRQGLVEQVLQSLAEAPVTILLGARQTGKTTLVDLVARALPPEAAKTLHRFDLEDPRDEAALSTPMTTLESLEGLVVIDEVQRRPELFTILRPLADRSSLPARFLLLGSASPTIVRGVSESLAGRAVFVHVPPLVLAELPEPRPDTLWLRGGFPRSYLAPSDEASSRWRRAFITTFLERDIPQLGYGMPSATLRRFWTMLAHYHGQTWNGAALGRALGTSAHTAVSYRDVLAGTYTIRVLPPWFANLKKRQIKSPRIYIRDSGLLHELLGLTTIHDLRRHPCYGASFEGFAIEQVLAAFGSHDTYFWRTQNGAELDLLLFRGGRSIGFEFKCADAPTMTKSMHVALRDLDLDRLYVVYPGSRAYQLADKVHVVPVSHCATLNLCRS